ncbi:MAG: hypothetical protein OES47_01515 [Acidobacteriota bacterium]|nr:hypothetical protein [Acidobacteriota bacterium]
MRGFLVNGQAQETRSLGPQGRQPLQCIHPFVAVELCLDRGGSAQIGSADTEVGRYTTGGSA